MVTMLPAMEASDPSKGEAGSECACACGDMVTNVEGMCDGDDSDEA